MSNDGASKSARSEELSSFLDMAADLVREQSQTREMLLLFVEVMDSFDRFFAVAGDDVLLLHLRSVRLIAKQFRQALAAAGATPMECLGSQVELGFHEVAGSRPDAVAPEDTILEVLVCGYLDRQGEPLRRARVIVSNGRQRE